jgi:hypothetical protein
MKLIHNKVYSCVYEGVSAIFKFDEETPYSAKHIFARRIYHDDSWDFWKDSNKLKEATPEDTHWLNVCIEKEKFVSKKEALKTFNQEVSLSFEL